jgi:hypothetical protein
MIFTKLLGFGMNTGMHKDCGKRNHRHTCSHEGHNPWYTVYIFQFHVFNISGRNLCQTVEQTERLESASQEASRIKTLLSEEFSTEKDNFVTVNIIFKKLGRSNETKM